MTSSLASQPVDAQDGASTGRSFHPGTASPAVLTGVLATVMAGALFGFFYAWVCSTMWGLDDADPRVAIAAMQAMNASVRNAVFFPVFFLTPLALGVAAGAAHLQKASRSAGYFAAAALVTLVGGVLFTMVANVPMNEELAQVTVPASIEEAEVIWNDYSAPWQARNIARTVFTGIALALASFGLVGLGRREVGSPRPPAA